MSYLQGILNASVQEKGDAITFVMEFDELSYIEALKYLALNIISLLKRKYKLTRFKQLKTSESLYIVLKYACDYFQKMLKLNEEG